MSIMAIHEKWFLLRPFLGKMFWVQTFSALWFAQQEEDIVLQTNFYTSYYISAAIFLLVLIFANAGV